MLNPLSIRPILLGGLLPVAVLTACPAPTAEFQAPTRSSYGNAGASYGNAGATSGEVRGIWVTRWDYRTKTDVQRAVRWSAAIGMNRVFFQVRGRADAFYRSRIEPWGEELGGADPGFDPLETALDEARRTGVELHAWVNLLPAWKGSRPPRSPDHLYHRRPEWFLVDSHGHRHLSNAADYTILNPCLPEVRSYLATVVGDIASRYAVDGVHLDYARFVSRDPRKDGDFPYDPRSLGLFYAYSKASPAAAPQLWDRWRTISVNTLVYRVAEAVRAHRPGCVVSVAAISNYERARGALFQDVAKWQERGWVDEAYPMSYSADHASFKRELTAILKQTPTGGRVYPGIAVFLHPTAQDTVLQIEATRAFGTRGYCLFAYASLFPSPSHEYRGDLNSRRLRSSLRATVYAVNRGEPPRPNALSDSRSLQLANPPPSWR